MTKSKNRTYLEGNLKRYHDSQATARSSLPSLRLSRRDSLAQAEARLAGTPLSLTGRSRLLSADARADFPAYKANIENYIGTVSVPLGLAGPLTINGSHAQGDYYIPLATTEAALVASYNRGLHVIKKSGGCVAMVLDHAVQRAPCFTFESLIQAAQFCVWIEEHFTALKAIAESTTRYGQLLHIDFKTESNLVLLIFNFTTGLASGQNMVTLATEAAYHYILSHCPIKPKTHVLEGNGSGDKKATIRSMMAVRGYKVSVEASISRAVFEKVLHVRLDAFMDFYHMAQDTGSLTMAINQHGQFANALAAMFIACGQDAACISEASTGICKFSQLDAEQVYVAVTMSNLIVGTVGGGTQLPHQKACLELIGLQSADNPSAELAEIIAGVCLAGEISLVAAISASDFARAHRVLARSRK